MKHSIGSMFCITGFLVFLSLVHGQDTRGTPGIDYPNYHSIPKTSFSCSEQKYIPGFYADLETKCQAFHVCLQDLQETFLCPTGTIFNQEMLVCDAWFNSNCSLAPLFYNVNAGPVIEFARRNLSMLMKLQNHAQSPEDVYEIMNSLFDSNREGKISEESKSDKDNKFDDSNPENEVQPSNVVQKLEDNLQKLPEVEERMYGDHFVEDEGIVEVENMDPRLVYDPVMNGYYTNYDQYGSEWQQYSEPVSDEFGNFYDYRSLVDQYAGLGDSSDYLTLDSMDSEGPQYVMESEPEVIVLDDIIGDSADDQFSRRQLEIDYATAEGSEVSSSLEESDTTTSEEPFPRPTRLPLSQRDFSTATPLSTDLFGDAIFSELVAPHLTEDDFGPNIAETAAPSNQQSSDPVQLSRRQLEIEYATAEGSEINSTLDESEQTTSEEPFPRPTRLPLSQRDFSTATPLSTNLFGDAIFAELVVPHLTEDDFGPNIAETAGSSDQSDPVQLSRRQLQVDVPFRRIRRRPKYVVVDSELDLDSRSRRKRNPNGQLASESVPTDMESSTESVEAGSDTNATSEDSEHSTSEEPFPRPTRLPLSQRDFSTATPLSTDLFGDAIFAELVAPHLTEDDFGPNIAETADASDRGERMLMDFPGVYEPEVSVEDSEVRPMYDEIEDNIWIDDANVDETSVDNSDVYLVVPNESEEDFTDFSEIQKSDGSFDSEYMYKSGRAHGQDTSDYDAYEEGYGYYEPRYSPEVYRSAYLHQLSRSMPIGNTPRFWRGQPTYQVVPESDTSYVRSFPYVPSEQISIAEDETVDNYRQQMARVNYVTSDGRRYEYASQQAYEDQPVYYDADGSFQYMGSNQMFDQDSTPVYSDAEVYPWAEQNERVVPGVTDPPLPVEETNFDGSSTNDANEETYYVFDFDGEQTEDNESDLGKDESSDKPLSNDSDELRFSNSREAKESTNHGPTLSESILLGSDSMLPSESTKSEDLEVQSLDTHTKTGDSSENIASLSALERLASLATTVSPGTPKSENLDSSKFRSNMPFSESMDFGPFGFGPNLGQQFNMVDSMKSKRDDDFSHRKGEPDAKLSQLSAIQERIRSMKQGKFGVFKKYMSSTRNLKE